MSEGKASNIANHNDNFDAEKAKEWAAKLKVTELRDELKKYGCSEKNFVAEKFVSVKAGKDFETGAEEEREF